MALTARRLETMPPGYRRLGYVECETAKAARFDYHGKKVWIPKKSLVFADGRYCAPAWAVQSSTEYQLKAEIQRVG